MAPVSESPGPIKALPSQPGHFTRRSQASRWWEAAAAARRGNEKAPRNVPGRAAAGGSEAEEGGPAGSSGVTPRGGGWDEPSWLQPPIRAPQGLPAWRPRAPHARRGAVGRGRYAGPRMLKCPFASGTLLLSNARLSPFLLPRREPGLGAHRPELCTHTPGAASLLSDCACDEWPAWPDKGL